MRWLCRILDRIGFEGLPRWSWIFVWILSPFYLLRRGQVRRNLKRAFPELDEKEIDTLGWRSFRSTVLSLMDVLWWCGWHSRETELARKWFTGEGVRFNDNSIKDALLRDGGIVCTGHFSTFPVIPQYFALFGPTGVFLKKVKNPFIQSRLDRLLRGMGVIPLYVDEKGAIRRAVEILRDKGIVVVLLDQHFGRKGRVEVEFFGHKAFSAGGVVELAQKMDKEIWACLVKRREDHFEITYVKRLFSPGIDVEGREIVQNFTNLLERAIMDSPEDWLWLHRRWKDLDRR